MDINTGGVVAFWLQCCGQHDLSENLNYHAGPFSDPALATYQDMLIDLVRQGRKRATARLDMEFERYGTARRGPGDLWLVTDTNGNPACLIRITDAQVWPFQDVPLSFAQREGEGDNSLEYWRRVHKEYFVQQCEQWGVQWQDYLLVCCEGFDLIAVA